MIQCLGTERLIRCQHDAREIVMVDRVRKMLCLETHARMAGILCTVLAGDLDRLVCHIQLHTRLIEGSGCLIAAPSANTSGKPSPTEASHVALDMDGRIPMILDGGPVGIGIESTIVDLSEETPMILRPGYITQEMLQEVLGEKVCMDPGIIASDSTRKPKAPGMKYKHYAPKADLVLVEGETDKVVARINELVREKQQLGQKVGVIATDETFLRYEADHVVSIGAREDEDAIARHLYKILREFDDWNVYAIYSESFATPRIGQAIMNRLLKAAGHQVIPVELHQGECRHFYETI